MWNQRNTNNLALVNILEFFNITRNGLIVHEREYARKHWCTNKYIDTTDTYPNYRQWEKGVGPPWPTQNLTSRSEIVDGPPLSVSPPRSKRHAKKRAILFYKAYDSFSISPHSELDREHFHDYFLTTYQRAMNIDFLHSTTQIAVTTMIIIHIWIKKVHHNGTHCSPDRWLD